MIVPYFWILLCLVVDANARSAKSTPDGADVEVLSPLQIEYAENQDAGKCKCENGFCKENNEGVSVCTCPTEWGLYSPGLCKKCNCGKDTNCSFEVSFWKESKTCLCKEGYGDRKGTCTECKCGNGSNCTFEEDRVWSNIIKTCVCKEGYKDKRGTCVAITFPTTNTPGTTRNFTGLSTHRPTVNETEPLPTFKISTLFPDSTTENSSKGHWFNITVDTTSTALRSTLVPTTGADPCSRNPCKNGGMCKIENEDTKCFCKEPFTGEFCESRINPCAWYPCKNGGVCMIENESMKCFCKEPFTGEFCESRIKYDAYVIVLVAISVFLSIVLLFVTCVLCQSYRVMKCEDAKKQLEMGSKSDVTKLDCLAR